mgnify:CR=1 FL=1
MMSIKKFTKKNQKKIKNHHIVNIIISLPDVDVGIHKIENPRVLSKHLDGKITPADSQKNAQGTASGILLQQLRELPAELDLARLRGRSGHLEIVCCLLYLLLLLLRNL